MKSLTLVIRCCNEANYLVVGEYLDALERYPFLKFVFVDDGSKDDTAEVLAYLEHVSPSVRALYLPKKVGQAEAVRRGVLKALEDRGCEAVGFWDSDLSTSLDEVESMVKRLESDPSCEAVLGARGVHPGMQAEREGFLHGVGGFLKSLIRFVFRAPAYDRPREAKIFRRACAERIFGRKFRSRRLSDADLLRMAAA